MLLCEVESMVEDVEGRVQFATLAFGEDLAEQGPDLGLGAEQFPAFPGAMDFVDHPPRQEFAEIHTDVAPRDAEPMPQVASAAPTDPKPAKPGKKPPKPSAHRTDLPPATVTILFQLGASESFARYCAPRGGDR